MQEIFKEYSKFGNAKSDGTQITLKNIDKWLKDAGIEDGKKVTSTDTGILYSKFKAPNGLDFKQFTEFVDSLAKEKKLDAAELKDKLSKCKAPSTSGATTADKSGVVDRMTDTSKYTGTHKERFDSEGKGKGMAGRKDEKPDTGYVQGYKNEDTFDKKK